MASLPGWAALPDALEQSSRYTVQVGSDRVPLLLRFEEAGKKLDRDRNGVLSPKELAATAKDLPGGLRVDLDDYCQGMAHELTGTPSTFASGYPSAVQIEAALAALRETYPQQVTLVSLGPSWQSRAVWAVRVSAGDGQERPRIAVIAQQHAREWIAHQVALASLRALLEDPANADLLETFEFWFVPLANPDGYEYSRLVEPMWRKNRGGSVGRDAEPLGVDLNRNFATEHFRRPGDSSESFEDDWGGSDRPYSSQYRGPQAGSEPETLYLQSLLSLPAMAGVIDVHGFGCKVVLPNPATKVPESDYQALAQGMLAALGPDYEVLRFRDLYPITGHLAAYADQRGIAGITLEVGKAFQPHPSKVRDTAGLGARGVLAFARALAKIRD
jgi:hypothetical protein